MSNEFYDHTTYPSNGAPGSSSALRSELDAIESGFNKLPTLGGNATRIIAVNLGGTALQAIVTTGSGNGVLATGPTLDSVRINTGLGLGVAPVSGFIGLHNAISMSDPGGSAHGIQSAGTVQSNVTAQANYFRTVAATAASAFTVGQLAHFSAEQGTFGAGSAVTVQYGFRVQSNLVGGASNYGFYGDLAAAAGRFNFYANGTAANHFKGLTTFATKFGYLDGVGSGGVVTQLTSKATAVTLNTPAGQIILNAANLAADTSVTFTFNSTSLEASDVMLFNILTGSTASYVVTAAVVAGSAQITLRNVTPGALAEALQIRYVIVRGAVN